MGGDLKWGPGDVCWGTALCLADHAEGTTFSLMNCQMMRVISSPSISTTGLATLILLSASRIEYRQCMMPRGRLVGEPLSSPPDLPLTLPWSARAQLPSVYSLPAAAPRPLGDVDPHHHDQHH